jgi:hypothetical protein
MNHKQYIALYYAIEQELSRILPSIAEGEYGYWSFTYSLQDHPSISIKDCQHLLECMIKELKQGAVYGMDTASVIIFVLKKKPTFIKFIIHEAKEQYNELYEAFGDELPLEHGCFIIESEME